jgi:hypothetical protein
VVGGEFVAGHTLLALVEIGGDMVTRVSGRQLVAHSLDHELAPARRMGDPAERLP